MLPLPLLSKQPRRLHVRRAFVVGAVQQAHDADEDRLGGLDGAPTLGGRLVPVLVVPRRVEDGDAEEAGLVVDVWVEGDGGEELEFGREMGVVYWEDHASSEVASCFGEASSLACCVCWVL